MVSFVTDSKVIQRIRVYIAKWMRDM